jgi:hypothetical protein
MENKTEKNKKNWFVRHWIITLILGLILLGMIGSLFNGGGNNQDSTGNVVLESNNQSQNEEKITLISTEPIREEIETCTPDWSCGSWSECSNSGMQTRTCTDLNNCNGNSKNKPSEAKTCEIAKEYIKNSYEETCEIFDLDSTYTDIQKEKIFNEQYDGLYTTWRGTIDDIDSSILNNLRLDVTMSCGTGRIYMNKDQYDQLILLSKGDEVSFTGRFYLQPTPKLFGGINFKLEDGELD